MDSIATRGYPTLEEIRQSCGYPSLQRIKKGPVAVIECVQEIPCNPCESACPVGAITIGEPFTSLPRLDEDKCTGCGRCISRCPGLAIFLVSKAEEGKALVSFPHEYLPLPQAGQTVQAVNRAGQAVCDGKVVRVQATKANEGTAVLTVAVPAEYGDEVRGIKRLPREEKS